MNFSKKLEFIWAKKVKQSMIPKDWMSFLASIKNMEISIIFEWMFPKILLLFLPGAGHYGRTNTMGCRKGGGVGGWWKPREQGFHVVM